MGLRNGERVTAAPSLERDPFGHRPQRAVASIWRTPNSMDAPARIGDTVGMRRALPVAYVQADETLS